MGKLWVCDDEPSTRFPVFTRGNIGEVFGQPVSPLTWTTLGVWALDRGWREGYYEMGLFTPDEFKPLGQAEILACFGGYLYINMSVLRVLAMRIPGMTVQAIDRAAFGDYSDVPAYRPDPRDRNAQRAAQGSGWLASLFTVDPLPPTEAIRARLDALVARRPDFTSLSDAQLLEHFRSHVEELRIQWQRHVLTSSGAMVLSGVIAQICQGVDATGLAPKVSRLSTWLTCSSAVCSRGPAAVEDRSEGAADIRGPGSTREAGLPPQAASDAVRASKAIPIERCIETHSEMGSCTS